MVDSLQKVCNKFLKINFPQSRNFKVNKVCRECKVLKINDLFRLEICSFIYKYLHKLLLSCFNNSFSFNFDRNNVNLRNSNDFYIPFFKYYHSAIFEIHRCCMWNNVPQETRYQKNLAKFRRRLRELMMKIIPNQKQEMIAVPISHFAFEF